MNPERSTTYIHLIDYDMIHVIVKNDPDAVISLFPKTKLNTSLKIIQRNIMQSIPANIFLQPKNPNDNPIGSKSI